MLYGNAESKYFIVVHACACVLCWINENHNKMKMLALATIAVVVDNGGDVVIASSVAAIFRAQQLSIKLELTRARIPFTFKHFSIQPHT